MSTERTGDRTGWIIALLGGVMLLSPLGQTIYTPSMAIIRDELTTTNAMVSASVAAYGAGMALSQIVYGPLVDRYSAKWVLLSGVALYILASAAAIVAPTIELLIVCRAAQSMGIGSAIVVGPAVIGDIVPPVRRGQAMGMFSGVAMIGPVIGPIAGAIIAAAFTWRADLVALTLVGIVAWLGAWWLLPPLTASAISLSASDVRRVLTNPTVTGCATLGFAQLMTLHGYLALLPVLFRDRFGLSELAIGPLLTSMTICLALGAAVGGRLSDRLGRRTVMLIGGFGALFATLGVVAVALVASADNLVPAVLSLLVLGGSISLNLPTQTSLMVDWFPDLRGTAIAVYNFIRFVGAACGPLLAGLAADRFGTGWAFLPGSIALGIGVIAAVALVRNPPGAVYGAAAVPAITSR